MKRVSLKQNKNNRRWVILAYTFILLSANFVGDYSLQIFYFTISMGTLLVQLAFCGVPALTEIFAFRKTAKIISIVGLINLLLAFGVYYGLSFPIPDFWVKGNSVNSLFTWQAIVVMTFSLSYVSAALTMVYLASILRTYLGKGWLWVRVALVSLVGLVVDMAVLVPVIYYLGPDEYMALWKILSLISVRITLTLFAIPFSYLLILLLKRKTLSFSPSYS